jgi:mono/diheme cytochrome c family protein
MRPLLRSITLVSILIFVVAVGIAGAQRDGDAENGAKLFLEYCSMCHGEDGRGRIGANLQNFPGIEPGLAMRSVIAEGVPGSVMPAWSEQNGGPLTEAQIDDITTYLLGVLGGTEPVVPAPTIRPPVIEPLPEVEGDPSQGAVVFERNCTACHGEQAEGGFGWPLAKPWPGNQPEVYIKSVVSGGIENSLMPAWSQDAGGPLTNEQIDDVAAFVLTLSPVQTLPTQAPEAVQGPLGTVSSLILIGVLVAAVLIGLVYYYRRA